MVDRLCQSQQRKQVSLMEVCGTHTMAISGFGIRRAVDPRLRLLSGPGCPVCVTAQEDIDEAIRLAGLPGVTVLTFGDMVRVPGSSRTLEGARAQGADVRVVYSALDGVELAKEDTDREFVFLGVGFETTAPTIAAAVLEAKRRRIANFSVLPMFKLIPPALRVVASSPRVNVDGLILPGHVSTVIGERPYRFLAKEYRLPCCITGFEALDVVQGIAMLLTQLAEQKPAVAIQYRRTVRPDGNPAARRVMNRVFRGCDAVWRGLGTVPGSGLEFRDRYSRYDCRNRLGTGPGHARRAGHGAFRGCRCGDVMLGVIVPPECRLFGERCTPEHPVGPCMVSSEGACAAYYKYEQ